MRAALVLSIVVFVGSGRARAEPPCAPRVVVVIDRSLPADKLAAVTGALAAAAPKMSAGVELGVVSAGPRAAVEVALAPAQGVAIHRVSGARKADLGGAIELAATRLAAGKRACGGSRIVVVTDGSELQPVNEVLNKLRGVVAVSAIGYQSLDRVMLQTLARGGQLYLTEQPREVVAAFTDAARLAPVPGAPRSLAVVFVADRSMSMQGAGLEAAKEIMRTSIELLAANDVVAVVTVDSEAHTYIAPQPATNRIRLSNQIAQLQPGGSTNWVDGLESAKALLKDINADDKVAILISDGDGPLDTAPEAARALFDAKILLVVVGVGRTQRDNLRALAQAGGGRLYFVDNLGDLPRLFGASGVR